MSIHLANSSDVWQAYTTGAAVPPLVFRNGLTLHHGPADAPVHLFFEVFANGCYRRRIPFPASGIVIDIGANAAASVASMSWRRTADHTLDVYRAALADSALSRPA